ncbi:hypothetical protein HK100_000953 [Physocladia obscura]|uniref:Large ribosomal subunit protein uL6 alpha-beta domain-containing protein n=1 Tax=Physocladia obscura TaxID=109957 RepID=A0AAD5XHK8_9FUNG|nr:hypothetical protein HK100_000953 [Physocladia obscura]
MVHSTAAVLSKVGKQMLRVPTGVTVATRGFNAGVDAGAYRGKAHEATTTVTVAGPRGSLALGLAPFVRVAVANGKAAVTVADPTDRLQKAMWGTTRRLLANLVVGVSEGFTVPVRLVGVGYRASLVDEPGNKHILLKLGHSHDIKVPVPDTVEVAIPAPQRLILSSNDKLVVTQLAANIRKHRPPEPYNQKGVFVGDETIKKKEGKKR